MKRKVRFVTLMALLPALMLLILASSAVSAQDGSNTDQLSTSTLIDLGDTTAYVSPGLLATMYRHRAGTETASTISVRIGHSENEDDFAAAVTAVQGTSAEDGTWNIPPSGLESIVQRSGVHVAELTVPFTGMPSDERLTRGLREAVIAYAAGVPESHAALYALVNDAGTVNVTVHSDTSAQKAEVKSWLSARGVATPADKAPEFATLSGMVPVGELRPLLAAFPEVRIGALEFRGYALPMKRSNWPAYASSFRTQTVAYMTTGARPAAPADSTGESGGPETTETTTRSHSILNERKVEGFHGVKRWLQSVPDLNGNGVRVGIIDWSFTDFDQNPHLPPILRTDSSNPDRAGANAFCQDPADGWWDMSLTGAPCEAELGGLQVGIDIKHGGQVAELVRHMAPSATLLFAQANSPRQLKAAADWLVAKDVDVIVHAAGWHFDGPGNDRSFFTQSNAPVANNAMHHSPHHYYPGAISTLNSVMGGPGAPVWVNAVGNQENLTLFMQSPTVIQSGDHRGFIDFDSGAGEEECFDLRLGGLTPVVVNMRWADNWNNPTHSLGFHFRQYSNDFGIGFLEQLEVVPWLDSDDGPDFAFPT